MEVGFFRLVVGFIGDVQALDVGDGDEIGVVFDRVAHESEGGIGEAVEGTGLAVEIDLVAVDVVEALGMGDGEWAEEEGVDETEGGGAGADGESEGEDCGGGGDAGLLELAEAEDSVGAEGVHDETESIPAIEHGGASPH